MRRLTAQSSCSVAIEANEDQSPKHRDYLTACVLRLSAEKYNYLALFLPLQIQTPGLMNPSESGLARAGRGAGTAV